VIPPTDGQRGTAILPSVSSNDATGDGPIAWSTLASNGAITCYGDDARIAVNSELCAATDVFAAGSVARHPGMQSGNAVVAGQSELGAANAGKLAAKNMAANYQKIKGLRFKGSYQQQTGPSFVSSDDDISTSRTDKLVYESSSSKSLSSHLSALGVHALTVGDCNSQDMATHGFWWTTKASNKRDREQQIDMNYFEEEDENEEDDEGNDNTEGDETTGAGRFTFMPASGEVVRLLPKKTARCLKKRDTTLIPQSGASSATAMSRPVYGMGIVYYLDRSGRLSGVMTWGLPFTEDDPSDVNAALLKRLKLLVKSNAAIAVRKGSQLTVGDLAEESKHIVSIACNEKNFTENIFYKNGKVAKPLHRYTPAKYSSVTGLGVLKRKDEAGNVIEDKLFLSTTNEQNEEQNSLVPTSQRPSSLIYIVPLDDAAYQGYLQNINPLQNVASANANRFRPSKEDRLWLRQDEFSKSQSALAVLNEGFRRNMLRGRMPDGSDPVSQAPVPEFVEKIKTWYSSSSTEDCDEDTLPINNSETKTEEPQ
jgi:hypothetical protein